MFTGIVFFAVPFLIIFDLPLQTIIQSMPVNGGILAIFTEVGNGAVNIALALVLLTANQRAGKAALGSIAVSGLLVNLAKYMIGRARPYTTPSPWVFIGPTLDGAHGSYPSGHTATLFTLAAVTAAFYPRLAVPVFTVAVLGGVSRVAIGMHWPSDVVAGAVLGIGVAHWWMWRQAIKAQKQLRTMRLSGEGRDR